MKFKNERPDMDLTFFNIGFAALTTVEVRDDLDPQKLAFLRNNLTEVKDPPPPPPREPVIVVETTLEKVLPDPPATVEGMPTDPIVRKVKAKRGKKVRARRAVHRREQ